MTVSKSSYLLLMPALLVLLAAVAVRSQSKPTLPTVTVYKQPT
jgi:hypothetical protein